MFGTTNQNVFGTATLAVNTWTHLAATYDRATIRLFVNGVQVSTAAQTAAVSTSNAVLTIGANFYGEYFAGLIDEVRIYNRALSAAEIQTDMSTAVGGSPPPADLTLTKTHAGTFTQGQVGATYALTVANLTGNGPTTGTVTVSDTLPTVLTATAMSGAGWSCTIATLTCTRSDLLAAGASYPAITLTVNVADNAPASLTNTATVSGGGETNTANDSAADVTAISVGRRAGPEDNQEPTAGTFTQGQTAATYALTVSQQPAQRRPAVR